jgi:hypothetical protein
MPTDYVTKFHFDEVVKDINIKLKKLEKLDKLSEQMDWLIGKYRNHDDEHELINNKLSEHSDNLEVINQKLGITV